MLIRLRIAGDHHDERRARRVQREIRPERRDGGFGDRY
jgi:hypothetical protein